MISRLSHLSRRHTHQKGFITRVVENIRNEWSQNKEIKENLEKFRKETEKLEETEAIRQARKKFKDVEADSLRDANEVFQTARDSLKSGVEKARETKIIRETLKLSDSISTRAKDAAEGISKQGEYLKETTAFKKMSEASKTVERELSDADMLSSLYRPPKELLTRSERSTLLSGDPQQQRQVEPNETVQSIELHKDSKWSESWAKFKDDNPYINKIFEIKMKYDESDSPLARVTKTFVDRVSDVMGGMFKNPELSRVLTEICKVDPGFDINTFTNDCEKIIIPTILESMSQGRLDVLEDWCSEPVFNVLSRPLTEAQKLGLKIHNRILDIQNFDLVTGQMTSDGRPVLVFTFQAQQISYVTDSKGNVREGDPDKIVQNTYAMGFCRDNDDLNPHTAWRLVDVGMQQSQFMF